MRGAFALPIQRLVTLLALILFVVGCGDNVSKDRPDAAPSTAKELTAFKFTDAANAALTADVTATINGNQIAATVPSGTNVTALVATFSTTGLQVRVGSTAQVSGTTANDFSSPVTYQVVAEDGSTRDYTVTVTVASNSAKELTAFSFTDADNDALEADVVATINGTSISATVPFSTDVTELVATFATTGTGVTVGGTAQVSGTTANDFSSAVTYRVTAADGSTQDYTVTVTVAANDEKDITAFSFTAANNPGVLTTDVNTTKNGTSISAIVPFGTNVTALVATFTTTGSAVAVGPTAQASNVTANDFTNPVTYTVTAADGSTKDYIVTVTVAENTAKAITAYSFEATNNTGVLTVDVDADINNNAITATVPFGTNVTALKATFVTTGDTIEVDGTEQVSGMTPNDFTNPVIYKVTAADGTTEDWTVTVTIAAGDAKAIETFEFLDVDNTALSANVTATIVGTNITATVPFGTDVTALKATFTTTGASVTINGTPQISHQTANSFSSPVTYTVHAADGSTQDYTVTVTVALNSAKEITSFSFLSSKNSGVLAVDVIATVNGNITAIVPFGTSRASLVASFSTTGQSVTVNGTAQDSGITANNFTGALVYRVTAEDSTFRDYTVTVTEAPSPAKAITAFSFLSAQNAALTADVIATITDGTSTIAATVPFGTNITALKATFVTTGASVAIGGTAQTSGTTVNNFTSPLTYTVTAADGSTRDYTVTVTIAPNTAKQLTAFSFEMAHNASLGTTVTGVINETTHTVAVTVPFGTTVTALKATFAITGENAEVGGVEQVSTQTANDFTPPVTYVVNAADGSAQSYVVTVTIAAPSTTKDITAFSLSKALNPGLPTDFVGVFLDEETIEIKVPTGTTVTALIPTFTTNGVKVEIEGALQTTNVTQVDFTGQVVIYTVTAQDGSTKDYLVGVTPAPYCGLLAAPTNGAVTYSDNAFVGSTATYTCNAGYALSGDATRECVAPSNTWDGTAPTCTQQEARFWVLKLGDGTTSVTNASARGVIEERRVSDGSVVRTLSLPTAASGDQLPLTLSGSANTEGHLALSADGKYVTLGGYATAPGLGNVNTSTTTNVMRVIGRIDAAGNIDTSTKLNALSGSNIRGASSFDGTSFWASGPNAVYHVNLGSTTGTATQVTSGSTNFRGNFILDGQLYGYSAAALFLVGSGTPTTGGQAVDAVVTIGGSNVQGIALLDLDPVINGPDTMYVVLDGSTTTGVLNIRKYTFTGTEWSMTANFRPATSGIAQALRVVAYPEGTSVRVIATTNTSGAGNNNNELVTFLDNGTNLTPTVQILDTAGTNYVFRGVSLPPHP
jgi:hypothetical protein